MTMRMIRWRMNCFEVRDGQKDLLSVSLKAISGHFPGPS